MVFLCLCILLSSSYKDTGCIGLGPSLVASFYLNWLFKGPISLNILRCCGLRCQHIHFFWGGEGWDTIHNRGQRQNEAQLKGRNLGTKINSLFIRWGQAGCMQVRQKKSLRSLWITCWPRVSNGLCKSQKHHFWIYRPSFLDLWNLGGQLSNSAVQWSGIPYAFLLNSKPKRDVKILDEIQKRTI